MPSKAQDSRQQTAKANNIEVGITDAPIKELERERLFKKLLREKYFTW